MKTPEGWEVGLKQRGLYITRHEVYEIQSDARADLEAENKALNERAESAEASLRERDLQMRAALEETESMFQRTQRAESENVELRERMKAMEDILKDCQHLRSQVFPLACFPECPACRWEAMKKVKA